MARAYALFAFLLAATAVRGVGLDFDPVAEPQKARLMYLAPESFLFYRLRLPDGRAVLLERNLGKPGVLMGTGGWGGTCKGDDAVVTMPSERGSEVTAVSFRRGIPYAASRGKARRSLAGGERARLPYDESPLFECMAERGESSGSTNPDGYWQDGRLAFPYENPNQSAMLYAGLGILALWLLMAPRRCMRIAGAALSAAFLGLLFWTASRGGLLAFLFGAGAVCARRYSRVFRLRLTWVCMAAVAVAVAVWFSVAPPKLVTRGSEPGPGGWSNRVRLELWGAAPRMMVDAPGGWEISPPGPAYVDWYQPLGSIAYTCTLMNDHLTRMAGFGWPMRFAYAFAWAMLLSLAAWFALKTGNAVPFGSWAALAIAAWFNPVTSGPWSFFVWLPAVASTFAMARFRTWLRRRAFAACALCAAAAAAAAVSCIYALGRADTRSPAVRTEGRRVCVGGGSPDTWIVDDGFALGGLMFGRDIRAFCLRNPGCAPVGYVRDVRDLPKSGVRRLVLAGRAGDDFLRATCSDRAGPKGLPPEIVFLSPPFPPQAVPAAVWGSSRVSMYIGELATLYSPEYDSVPSWVTVVPGAVRYFPEWMRYAVGEPAAERSF